MGVAPFIRPRRTKVPWRAWVLSAAAACLVAVPPCRASGMSNVAQAVPPVPPWVRWTAVGVGLGIGVAMAVALWNIRLRQYVRARTSQLEAKNKALLEERENRQRDFSLLQAAEQNLLESRQRLELISSIATHINAGMEPSEVVGRVVEHLAEFFPAHRVRFCTLTRGGVMNVEESVEARDGSMPALRGMACDLSDAPEFLSALRAGGAVAVVDVASDPRLAAVRPFMQKAGIGASLCYGLSIPEVAPPVAPFTVQRQGAGGVTGLVALDAPGPHDWTEHELSTLTQACEYLTIAVQGARTVQDRLHAEEQLRTSEERQRLITQNMPALVFAINSLGRIVFWNHEAERVTGYAAGEIVGDPLGLEKLLPDTSYRKAVMAVWESEGSAKEEGESARIEDSTRVIVLKNGEHSRSLAPSHSRTPARGVRDLEFNIACKDGSERTLSWSSIARQAPVPGWANWGIALDVTDRRAAEERVRQSEERYRLLFESSPQPMWVYDNATMRFLEVNEAAMREYGYARDEFLAMRITDIRPVEDVTRLLRVAEKSGDRLVTGSGPWRHRKKTGEVVDVEVSSHTVPFIAKDARLVIVTDVTQRVRSLQALRESRALLEQAQAVAHVGSWVSDPGQHEGTVLWSRETCRIFGMPDEQDEFPIGVADFFSRVHPEDRDAVQAAAGAALAGGTPYSIDHRITRPDGSVRWVHEEAQIERDPAGRPIRMVGVVQDITERKLAESEIAQRAQELARSNAELERFAYVASHDLQEPLRMVTSFTQLLGQRYKGKLDKDADEFIGFAVEGAMRMQRLIEDLLAFSRVGAANRRPGRIKSQSALARAMANLHAAIQDSQAHVTWDGMPEVTADESQLSMVFQNLVANAIKFRAGPGPKIHVAVAREGGQWKFTVQDDGIGIDEKHRERIFTMFQRLHPRSVYPGNGIGLAICKRILEGHGGRIWVEPSPGRGSTFCFTLPEDQA